MKRGCVEALVVGVVLAVGCGSAPSAQAPAAPPPAAVQTGGADPVVAQVGGHEIRLSEVDAKWQEFDAAERARLTQLLYQNRRNILDLMVGDALIADAAKAAGVSPDAYLDRELTRRAQAVSDADIREFYEENKDRAQGRSMDDLRQPIREFLESQRRQQARARLVSDLRGRTSDVRVLLDPPRVTVTVNDEDPSMGPLTAPITIVEYSDFQCPFCARAVPTLKQVVETFGDQVRLVYKDFPLPSHPLAPKAAEAAHCAGDQGKYWEMHDLMFADISALSVPQLKEGAAKLGLDRTAFDRCLDSGKHEGRVTAGYEEGEKLGVNSTPTIYINGRPLIGAQPFEVFKQVIDEELARK